jgi:hypothetical protein
MHGSTPKNGSVAEPGLSVVEPTSGVILDIIIHEKRTLLVNNGREAEIERKGV